MSLLKKNILLLILIVFAKGLTASVLSSDEAFKLTAKVTNPNAMALEFDIAHGYLLYQDKIRLKLDNTHYAQLGQLMLPPAHSVLHDEHDVYERNVTINVPILGVAPGEVNMTLTYQGCSLSGICYPPIQKEVTITIDNDFALSRLSVANKVPAKTVETPVKKQKGLTDVINGDFEDLFDQSIYFIVLLFFVMGVLLSFTPCVLPMIPVLSSMILGKKKLTASRGFCLSLTYVISMSLTYAFVGLMIASLGVHMQTFLQMPWVLSLLAALFVLLALSMFGYYQIKLPEKFEAYLSKKAQHQQRGSLVSVALMGVLATLILSPCVTPPLVGVLTYIGQSGERLIGALSLFSLGFGMGLPLILIGASLGKWVPKSGPWMVAINRVFGGLLIMVAIDLLSRFLPGPWVLVLWAIFLIVCGLALGALNRKAIKGAVLLQGLGLLSLVYSVLLIIGAAGGSSDPLNPLKGQEPLDHTHQYSSVKANAHYTLQDVLSHLEDAKANGKIAILDFYATWCTTCQYMQRTTFTNSQVRQALKEIVFIKIDVSNMTKDTKAISQRFGVIAPPTMLFFAPSGKELTGARKTGKVSAKALIQQLKAISDKNKLK